VKVRRFDPTDDLIIVKARLYGPRGYRPLSLAFDTAASETHIVPEITDDLGYSPRQGGAITSVSSAIGKEPGYMLRVTRFASLGVSFPELAVHVHDLPEGIGIDGLLGLSFLRHFNYEVRSQEGRICIDGITG
jgi:predicted aspartyl protease